VLVLSACGGSSTGSGGTTAGVTPTPTPTPTPTGPTTADLNAIVQRTLAIDLAAPANYAAPTLPAYYDNTVAQLDNTPAGNPITNPVATVGRVLFYDRALSVNDTTSCATCHQQALGFDDNERFSEGFAGGQFTGAHAMRLGNMRYWEPGTMFWDRRAASVEAQATAPILNEVEMGWVNNGGLPALITKMQGRDYYPALFTWAFGDETITQARIERALAQFQRAMISSDSRWDRAYAQVFAPGQPGRGLDQPLPGFSASENRGRQLFIDPPGQGGAGCAACHVPPTFALAAGSRSNGLDAGETVVFRSPSLKSVGRSRFFMHDGRFTTLLQVVEHYNNGVQAGPALDNRLTRNGLPQRLNLSPADRQALVDFMLTLDDPTLAADPRFSNPFR
jgi:cytochrome c peroxidase